MIVTLEETKKYLRVDSSDDDGILEQIISAAEKLCLDVSRLDDLETLAQAENAKVSVLYAAAYMYEHREEADYHALTLSLRSLLFGIRKEGF